MLYFIKNLGITTCCIYFFIKLLHLTVTKKSYIVFLSFAMALTIFSIALDSYCPQLYPFYCGGNDKWYFMSCTS